MKILVISPTFPPMSSGGADYSFRLCQNLARRGENVHVITSDIPNVIASDEFEISPVMRRWSWDELFRLLKVARKFGPDVVDIHFSGAIFKNHPMITVLPVALKRLMSRVRIILHIEYPEPIHAARRLSRARLIRECFMFWGGRKNTDYGYGALLRDSDQVIVLCDTHVGLLAKHYRDVIPKCIMIPPPPSLRLSDNIGGSARDRGRIESNVAPTDILLAYYGYIYPNKGIETLIQALELITRSVPNVRLVMIGGTNEVVLASCNRPNYLQELKDYAQQLGVADKLLWTGYFPSDSDQPSVLLRAADICVLPFDSGISMHRSTFGVAAMHDLPVVTTRADILETQFKDGENLLLCPPGDPHALAEVTLRLIADAELQERLREGLRTMTKTYFTWNTCIDQTLKAFAAK